MMVKLNVQLTLVLSQAGIHLLFSKNTKIPFPSWKYVSQYKNQTNSGNNSIPVRAEVDLSSPLQAISMAGLNLFNPKTEANHPLLLCQTCWCVHVLLQPASGHTWHQKMFVLTPVRLPWDRKSRQRDRAREREKEEWRGSEAKWQSQCVDLGCYCGKYHRGAAERYVTEQGWEQGRVFVCEGHSSDHIPHLLWFRIKHTKINSGKWLKNPLNMWMYCWASSQC